MIALNWILSYPIGKFQPATVPRRIVVLNRPEDTGLGFNIIGGEGNTGIFVSYISPGSVADKCGELKPGDKVIKVSFGCYGYTHGFTLLPP